MITQQCSADTPNARQITSHGETLWVVDSYEGCVIELRERNYYDDSDFYAYVWCESDQSIVPVQYATTRFWTYANNATVDASPEIKAKAEAYRRAKREEAQAELARHKDACPAVGDIVTIDGFKRGKNLPLNGKSGEVFWIGQSAYDRFATVIGVKVDGAKHFVPDNRAFKNGKSANDAFSDLKAYRVVEGVRASAYGY